MNNQNQTTDPLSVFFDGDHLVLAKSPTDACLYHSTDDEVQRALAEFNDFAELNTPEVNMRGALDWVLYERREKLSGRSHDV